MMQLERERGRGREIKEEDQSDILRLTVAAAEAAEAAVAALAPLRSRCWPTGPGGGRTWSGACVAMRRLFGLTGGRATAAVWPGEEAAAAAGWPVESKRTERAPARPSPSPLSP